MNPDVLELLEFSRVRELLVQLASSYSGKVRLESTRPLDTPQEAQFILEQVGVLRRLQESGNGFPGMALGDLSAVLTKLDREGSRLDPEEFLEVGKLLDTIRRVATHRSSWEPEEQCVRSLIERLEPQPALERSLQETFEPTGEIKDSASSALRKIRRERERLRSGLRKSLEKKAGSVSEESLVTLRDGRFVLSVPHAKEKRVQGIVVDRSSTGATVYLEPLESVEENNQLRTKDAEEFEEIQKILLELTRRLAAQGHALETGYRTLGELDALSARARLATRWRAEPPEFVSESRLELNQARHPLLLEARNVAARPEEAFASVIPLTVSLEPDRHMMLISGPNMGGKTVALKCVGLLTLMAQAGLFLPVEGPVRLGWIEHWVVDVGDEQSLEGDVSTFAGHLHHWKQALEAAGPASLVLLDELGSGTDPTEGAALAQSVLEALVDAGTLGVITTHMGALKRFAAATEGVENGSMIFDGDSGAPTYTLAPGVPGDSHALEMAAHLGFPRGRVQRAEALLSTEERDLKKLIADVEAERDHLRGERAQAQQEFRRAQQETKKAKEALARVLEARKDIRDRTARQARSILTKAQNQARELEKAHRQSGKKPSRLLRDAAQQQARWAQLEQPAPQDVPVGPVPERIEEGKEYYAVSLGGPVTVLRVSSDDGRAHVDCRGMKVELSLADLRESLQEAAPSSHKGPVPVPPLEEVSGEIHLLGKRADEALDLLDQALDRALLAGLPELRVVHGFGTGALMRAVRDFVGSHPAVKSFRSGEKGEGGGGATIVKLDSA